MNHEVQIGVRTVFVMMNLFDGVSIMPAAVIITLLVGFAYFFKVKNTYAITKTHLHKFNQHTIINKLQNCSIKLTYGEVKAHIRKFLLEFFYQRLPEPVFL